MSDDKDRLALVSLVIYRLADEEFDPKLSIPVHEMMKYTLRPRKWLLFICYAVTGRHGALSLEEGGDPICNTDMEKGTLGEEDRQFYFVPEEQEEQTADPLVSMINTFLVTKTRSSASTKSYSRHAAFRANIIKRDGPQDPIGLSGDPYHAHHFVLWSRQKFFVDLLTSRKRLYRKDDGLITGMIDTGINCVQNGLLVELNAHNFLDASKAAVLKTPNPYLATNDIPPSEPGRRRDDPLDDIARDYRYTLQFFNSPPRKLYPDPNVDALFPRGVKRSRLPHSIILDYVYGAAAVKRWSVNEKAITTYLTTRKGVYQPPDSTTESEQKLSEESDGSDPVEPQETTGLSTDDAWELMFLLSQQTPHGRQLLAMQQQAQAEHKARIEHWVTSQVATT